MKCTWLLIILYCLNTVSVFSQEKTTVSEQFKPIEITSSYITKPIFYKCITNVPKDIFSIAKSPFIKDNWKTFSGITAGTIILALKDQQIINWVKKSSTTIGLDPTTKYHDALKFGDTRIIKIPQNLNSALYQLGEGGTSMIVAGGLLIFGKINHNWRDIQASYDLIETFATMGVSTQILKRISGRESPFQSTQSGGKWSPLPSFSNYQNHTPSYDAFPSGHLATMVATVTVLTTDYPEKRWIKPIGFSLIGLTGWAMMNTEVHWMSDYPLAIAVGYLSGRITSMRNKKTVKKIEKYSLL